MCINKVFAASPSTPQALPVLAFLSALKMCRPPLPQFLLVTLRTIRKPRRFTVFMIHLDFYLKLPLGSWSALTLLLLVGMCFHPKISLSLSQQMFIESIPCKIEVSSSSLL